MEKKLLASTIRECAMEMLEKLGQKLQINFSDEVKAQRVKEIVQTLQKGFSLDEINAIDWENLDIEKCLNLETDYVSHCAFRGVDDWDEIYSRPFVCYRWYVLKFTYGNICFKSRKKNFYKVDEGVWGGSWLGLVFFDKKEAHAKKPLPNNLKDLMKNILLTKDQKLMEELVDIYAYNDLMNY